MGVGFIAWAHYPQGLPKGSQGQKVWCLVDLVNLGLTGIAFDFSWEGRSGLGIGLEPVRLLRLSLASLFFVSRLYWFLVGDILKLIILKTLLFAITKM